MNTYEKTMPMNDSWAPGSSGRWDIVGACLSLLCLAHCMILPFLPLLLSALPWLENEMLHKGLLVLITPVALFALFRGIKHHGNKMTLLWGGIGLALMLAAPFSGESLEKPLTVVGSLVLCFAHLKNRKSLQG